MKLLPFCFAGVATALFAEPPLPSFDETLTGPPSLALHELTKKPSKPTTFEPSIPNYAEGAPGPHLLDGFPLRRAVARIVPPSRNFSVKSAPGGMPILEPNPAIDYKVVLKEPDPTVDFKILMPQTPQGTADAKTTK